MIVEKYISQLLKSNDCVIVPRFGAFIKHYESASVHPITHKFSPPYKVIGFNGRLVLNDNLLLKHIAVGEDCTDEQAMHHIVFFIHSLKQHINKFGFFEFENIGRFFLNKEGKLQFDPELSDHFSDDTFGLKEFIVQPIDRTSYTMATTNYSKSTSTKKVEIPQDNKIEKGDFKKGNALKVIFIIVPVLVLLSAGGFLVFLKQTDRSIAGFDVAEMLGMKEEHKAVVKADSVVAPVVDSIQISEVVVTEEVAAPVESAAYCVVIGSFQNSTFAQSYSDKLNAKGLSTTIISGDNGYYRVAVEGLNKAEAIKKKKELSFQYGSSIWVMKK